VETREPTQDDLDELRMLIDAQESALDPNHKPASPSWPFELLRGHNDAPRNQVWLDDGKIVAWASMQPDEHRHRIEIELFRVPGFPQLRSAWDWCLSVGAADYPDWVLWPTLNHLDVEMAAMLTETGFELLRRYHFVTRPLRDDAYPELPEGVSIDVVTTADDFLEWHAAHQDSFSQHFGFTPRPAEPWIKHFTEYDGADPNGRFLLRVNGEVAGFVTCTNDNAHDNGGYVDLLGVRHAFHGQGFGKLLLRWAFAYCSSRGFTDVDLAVDTGNTSGALGLYSAVGFTTLSEFHLYARPAQPSPDAG
jgi:ribosomal protein S18 acetylase RimI-like enzyme